MTDDIDNNNNELIPPIQGMEMRTGSRIVQQNTELEEDFAGRTENMDAW